MKKKTKIPGIRRLQKRLKRVRSGAGNALKLMREGRLGAPYHAPFSVEHEEGILKLRRYSAPEQSEGDSYTATILLIPPLMVTSEIYDISPEFSAVTWLVAHGVDVWLTDFGSPEEEEGGWERTLDEHILAIHHAVDRVVERTGRPVHLAGYSQGGIFAYLVAAYRKNKDVASLITFGSPVDLRRNIPVKIHDTLTERLLSVAHNTIKGPLEELRGIPGLLNSYGFKLVSPKQEIKHTLKFLGLLHDEKALEKIIPKRRFLGGDGFIGWPGPAFSKFVEDVVVNNRLVAGGLVLNGRSISLSEIQCPVLFFVGEKDDMARPSSVRAIRKVVQLEELYECAVRAGHFGLVVGSKAVQEVWPNVVDWLTWQEGQGPIPDFLTPKEDSEQNTSPEPLAKSAEEDRSVQPLYDFATDVLDSLWHRLGEASLSVSDVLHSMQWQLPRMARLTSMRANTKVSVGKAIQEQAEAIPDTPFFFWRGRAFSYAEGNHWVEQLFEALVHSQIRPEQRIGVWMGSHPACLVTLAALNRLGAVTVLIPPKVSKETLIEIAEMASLKALITDAKQAPLAVDFGLDLPIYCFEQPPLDVVLPESVPLLNELFGKVSEESLERVERNPGRADSMGMLLVQLEHEQVQLIPITHRKWSQSALLTAASCALTPRDTVFCCLPLHESMGLMCAVSGALLGGARLVLAETFSPDTFWGDVRKAGASVLFHSGELTKFLACSGADVREKIASLRVLAGEELDEESSTRLRKTLGKVEFITL